MRSSFGITLIELLIGLILVSIILIFSASSYDLVFKKNKLEIRAYEVRRIIQYAKAQALAEGKPMILKPINNDWSNGMKLVQGNALYSEKMEVKHEWHWYLKGIKISWRGFRSNQYLVFSPELRENAVNGYFKLSDKSQMYKLTLNRLARVTMQRFLKDNQGFLIKLGKDDTQKKQNKDCV